MLINENEALKLISVSKFVPSAPNLSSEMSKIKILTGVFLIQLCCFAVSLILST